MSLILICGLPASGKSTVAAALSSHFEQLNLKVTTICDGSDHMHETETSSFAEQSIPSRKLLYKDSTTEKQTRARLRAATERALSSRMQVVLVDSLNYIKGFRYELFLVAKTAGKTFGLVYTPLAEDLCSQRDSQRAADGDDSYGEEILAGLVSRFEAPNERNRWDSPMSIVDTTTHDWKAAIATSAARVRSGKQLSATMATQPSALPQSDALAKIDRVTRQAEATIIAALQSGPSAGNKVSIAGSSKPVLLYRKPRVAEVRNMRRAYLNLCRLHVPSCDADRLVDEYVDYINAQLGKPQS